ncbi:beta-N-acetylhexosaminidase [Azoarcus indigens]|uniref:Beta-hexosaminidase n=1 Tax=Azoarcus indigens TaxID=29545 RepID=A0A4R6EDF2_9RHOO|nr:beta-N-acetylhexosaminidase [Azoarcus indigens]NMG64179.1 beta-N-acetylhexosaminidase [Azoarcus indigens]TDN55774.1 beta-N-acetylhexosaminidase [Azoarcus indigens]
MNTNASSETSRLPRGPLMVDVAGLVLTDAERTRLRHPLVGGVILFARNFSDSAQLKALAAEIHALRQPALPIAVDHEGGRVQRFKEDGFTRLPAMRSLGLLWNVDRQAARKSAQAAGYVLAADLLAHGIDLSFAPVLDLDYGVSRAIGNRAFHGDAAVTAELAGAVARGMAAAGMGAVGKHFPGHGFVEADSHHEIPVDSRGFDALWEADIAPYRGPLGSQLTGVMPAHVIYPAVAPEPAGFSHYWLQEVLRKRVGFGGLVFSDDLNMEGAAWAGDIVGRAEAAWQAGCDMLLVCNRPEVTDDLLARWQPTPRPDALARIAALDCPALAAPDRRAEDAAYREACQRLANLDPLDAGPAMTAGTIGDKAAG